MKCILIAVFTCCVLVAVDSLPSDDRTDIPSSQNTLNKNLTSSEFTEVTKIAISDDVIRHRRFIPFARPNSKTANISECTSSSEDFPNFIPENILEKGGVVFCFLIGIYCFTLLAIVCDKYFIPCVELICDVLNLSKDVAAATFMSTATSCPELFTNIISTFVTKSDLGIGTIVGSSMFNTLGVAALGGLAATTPIKIDGWPLTRDVIIYILAVSLLVSITWDNKVEWYEGLTLFALYFMYCIVLFNNNRISTFFKNRVQGEEEKEEEVENGVYRNKSIEAKVTKEEPLKISVISTSYSEETNVEVVETKEVEKEEEEEEETGLFRRPKGTILQKIFFYYVWPIKFFLQITVPDPTKYPKVYPITFVMCIIWIGVNSYIVSWMMTLIGNVFKIPDAVLGLTFLAAGGCLPESISIVIMSRRGEGSMGVSNSMGANTMNILLSLGFPWFFKTMLKSGGAHSYVEIESGSIQYTILALVAVALTLYGTLYFHQFHMSKKSGCILLLVYAVCAILAILSEMVFFPSNDCR